MKNQPNYPARPFSEYPVLDVTDWPVESPEPTGDDPKDWLVDPAGQHWLFKPREVKEGWAQGEDWAEKIAAQLAASLGIPTADIELAARGVERGSLSRKIIPAGYTLQPGEVLIAERLADWAVLLTAEGAESVLAPSYDHATSLGFNFLDSRRQAYLAGDQLARWAGKGTAHRFEARPDGPRQTLVALAHDALSRCSASAKRRWHRAINDWDEEALGSIVARVPDMSDLARTFAVAVVETNRRRLLDGD